MVDFKKLNDPAFRAQLQREREEEDRAHNEMLRLRVQAIEAWEDDPAALAGLSKFERDFMGTLQRYAQAQDLITMQLGGKLMFLSAEQRPIFDRIVHKLGRADLAHPPRAQRAQSTPAPSVSADAAPPPATFTGESGEGSEGPAPSTPAAERALTAVERALKLSAEFNRSPRATYPRERG